MAEFNFRPPPPLDVHDLDIGQSFQRWERQLNVYLTASGTTEKSKEVQSSVILYCAGPDVIDASPHFTWKKENGQEMTAEEKKEPANLLKQIKKYVIPTESEVSQSHKFWNIEWKSSFDSFLTELRNRADMCNFAEKDRMLRDKIVFSSTGKTLELLLADTKLDLPRAIAHCRSREQSVMQAKEMTAATKKIEKVSYSQETQPQNRSDRSENRSSYIKKLQFL